MKLPVLLLGRLAGCDGAVLEGPRCSLPSVGGECLGAPSSPAGLALLSRSRPSDAPRAPPCLESLPEGARRITPASLSGHPAGYREVGCATLSFCDEEGECIAAVRMARMPEPHKKGLKKSILAELKKAIDMRPDLRHVLPEDPDGANKVIRALTCTQAPAPPRSASPRLLRA